MNTRTEKEANAYDLVPYESDPHPHLHPDSLATIAKLFGIEAPAANSCRVLELGCGCADNLVATAYTLPAAKFVGVDLSPRQIEKGQLLASELGLKNIELFATDIRQIDHDLGEFDYIIADGVYSWVSSELQDKILQICSKNLKNNGVVYISYNTYPGWHFSGMIREMMLYHCAQLADPSARLAQAKALLKFLSESVPAELDAYSLMLKSELQRISQLRDCYLLHEYLEDCNEPIYFHNFVDRAQAHGLQYLGEAEFRAMIATNFGEAVESTLRRISTDIVHTEQYMDFIRNRRFRQTLLCKKELLINRKLSHESVASFLFSSPLKAENPQLDLRSAQAESFILPNGDKITATHPFNKAAFLSLSELWPQSVCFDDLLNKTLARLTAAGLKDSQSYAAQRQTLGENLLNAYAAGTVIFRSEEAPFIARVSERPQTSALSRLQARTQDFVTNQWHDKIVVDIFARKLIILLDGQHDHKQILAELMKSLSQNELVIKKDGERITDLPNTQQILETLVQECFQMLAKAALLIA